MPDYRQFFITGGKYGSAEKKTFAFANPLHPDCPSVRSVENPKNPIVCAGAAENTRGGLFLISQLKQNRSISCVLPWMPWAATMVQRS